MKTIDRRDLLKAAEVAALTRLIPSVPQLADGPGIRRHNKKGIRINMLPPGLSLTAGFSLARDCGFSQMEPFATFDGQRVIEIQSAAHKSGIHIGSVANPMNWQYPLTSGEPALAAEGIKAQTAALENAHAWGADAILMIPGVVTPEVSYEQAWVRSRRQIERLLPVAEKLGVVIALEEVCDQSKFLLSPREFVRYIDAFRSPYLRAYFDVGNVMPVGYPQDWIHQLGHRIEKVHVKDWNPKTRKFVDPGGGAVNWPAVRQAFIDVGYKGTFTVELGPGDAAYLKDLSQRIDRLLLS
jgi:L-ribulose-5-phosphate 3-epimerase